MKNTFLIICASVLFGFSASAQTSKKKVVTPKVNVPENVNNVFVTQHAGVENSSWAKSYSGNYIATFTNMNNLSQSAEYSAKGDLVKTTTTLDVNALPENITKAVNANYATSKVVEALKVEMPGVASFYKVKVEDENKKQRNVLISEEGSVTE